MYVGLVVQVMYVGTFVGESRDIASWCGWLGRPLYFLVAACPVITCTYMYCRYYMYCMYVHVVGWVAKPKLAQSGLGLYFAFTGPHSGHPILLLRECHQGSRSAGRLSRLCLGRRKVQSRIAFPLEDDKRTPVAAEPIIII